MSDVFIFDGEQMIAANGKLEARNGDVIGNKGFASVEIDCIAVSVEARQIMKAQMRDGPEEIVNIVKLCRE